MHASSLENPESRHAHTTAVAFYDSFIYVAYSFRHPGALQDATLAYANHGYPSSHNVLVENPDINDTLGRRQQLTSRLGLVMVESLRELDIPRGHNLSRRQASRVKQHLDRVTEESINNSQRLFTEDSVLQYLAKPLKRKAVREHLLQNINKPVQLRSVLPLAVLLGKYQQHI